MTVLVATASWTDNSLIDSGQFYPPTVKDAGDATCGTSPIANVAQLRSPQTRTLALSLPL